MPTLANLFNQKSQVLYNKFSPSDDQLVSITPNTKGVLGLTRDTIKYDTRSLPVSSVIRDTVRISKLLNPFRSPKSALLLGKQYLLQTGNTFQQTRLYNPLSPIVNVVPFLYYLRSIKRDPHLLLQAESINKATALFGETTTLSNQQVMGSYNTGIATDSSRPEYKVFYQSSKFKGPTLFLQQPTKVKANYVAATPENNSGYATEFITQAEAFRQKFLDDKRLKQKLFDTGSRAQRLKSSYIEELNSQPEISGNPTDSKLPSTLTGIFDPYNRDKEPYLDSRQQVPTDRIDYNNIITPTETLNNEGKTDIIKFIFSEAGGTNVNPVQFRALLSSIKESIKTEFNEQRYVGRTERFVTYGGAKRGVSLSFNIVAFSSNEVTGMWSRVNYLSGLAFPKGVKNGFMVPPLFNITVGGIYDNQPCYIESLDYDFLDDNITFDIQREIPFAINVTMQLSLLEKRSKFHDSPFYQISEQILTEQLALEQLRQQNLQDRLGDLVTDNELTQYSKRLAEQANASRKTMQNLGNAVNARNVQEELMRQRNLSIAPSGARMGQAR